MSDKIIESLLSRMAEKDNRIDINAYTRGLLDMYNALTWVKTSPPIDTDDHWNKTLQQSKRVLTRSKEWGIRFGHYNHFLKSWNLDNVSSSNGIQVDEWLDTDNFKDPIE